MMSRISEFSRRYWLRISIAVGLLLIIALLYIFNVHQWITLAKMRTYQEHIVAFIERYYWQSVIIYILFYVLEGVFALPLAAPLSIAAGFFYGFWLGLLYVMIGSTSGATASFVLTRFVIGSVIQRTYKKKLQRFNREIEQYGAYYLLFLRIVPVFPFFLVNMFAGLTELHLFTFVIITFFGMIPMAAIFVFAGAQLHMLHRPESIWSWQFIGVLIILGLIVGGTIIWKRRRKI